jgi:hypothetical protein
MERMVTDEFNAFLRIRAPSSLLKFVDSLSTTSTDKPSSSKKNARSPSAAPMSATLPYLPLQSSKRSTPPPATSRSNTGRFRSVAYGYQNGLGRRANLALQRSCSLVSASSRSDDVFAWALLDLTQGLLACLARRREGLGWTKIWRVFQKSARFAETGQVIVISQPKHSRMAADSYRQMLPSLFVGLGPTPEFRALRATVYFR